MHAENQLAHAARHLRDPTQSIKIDSVLSLCTRKQIRQINDHNQTITNLLDSQGKKEADFSLEKPYKIDTKREWNLTNCTSIQPSFLRSSHLISTESVIDFGHLWPCGAQQPSFYVTLKLLLRNSSFSP